MLAGRADPRSRVARTAAEAEAAVRELGEYAALASRRFDAERVGIPCVIKAQVLGGGGAFEAVESAEQAAAVASVMLGSRQTEAPDSPGQAVREVLVAEVASDAQWYLAMGIDRERCCPAVVVSAEDVAAVPWEQQRVATFPFGLSEGVTAGLVARVAAQLRLSRAGEAERLGCVLRALHRLFAQREATALELAPLVRLAVLGARGSSGRRRRGQG